MGGIRAMLLAFLVLTVAAATGQTLLLRLAYILMAVLLVSLVWSVFSLRGIDVTRRARSDRASVGQTFDETLIARNRPLLPRLWLEIHDHSTLPEHAAGTVIALPGRSSYRWEISTPLRRRGVYRLGPVTLVGGDPFGFFKMRRHIPETQNVLIYPFAYDLPHLNAVFGDVTGGARLQTGWHQVTPHASNVREWAPGDSLSRIHWPSSARVQRLMVKEFDLDPTADVWILLDLEAAVHVGEGEDSTEEYAVTAAASLAHHFLGRGRAVGLIASGDQHLVISPERGQRQLIRLLERLATVEASGTVPLAGLLTAEGPRFKRSAAAIVITPSLDDRWPAALRQLADRRVRPYAVFLEPATFGPAASAILLVSALAAADVPTFTAKRGEPLDTVLASSSAMSSRTGMAR